MFGRGVIGPEIEGPSTTPSDLMSTTHIDDQREVGQIVRDHPSVGSVFETFGIDYCCNGDRSLREAATAEGVDPTQLIRELESSTAEEETPEKWDSLEELIEHVESTHHDHLRGELPSLSELVAKVRVVHADDHPELAAVHRTFNDLADEMLTHIREEEVNAFPIIVKVDRGEPLNEDEQRRLQEELRGLEEDHEDTAANLDRLDELTEGFTVPDGACPSYELMLERLAGLKSYTHQHVHKENNVLFRDVESQLA